MFLLILNKLRAIILLLLLASCSTDLTYFNIFKQAFAYSKIDVNDGQIEKIKYSFIKVTLGRNQAIFVLSEITKENIFIWVGANNEKIHTYHGYVIHTDGFSPSYNIQDKSKLLEYDFNNFSNQELLIFFSIESPEINYIEATIGSPSNYNKNCSEFYLTAPLIKFKGKTIICYSSNGMPLLTKQKLSPLHDVLRLEYFYK